MHSRRGDACRPGIARTGDHVITASTAPPARRRPDPFWLDNPAAPAPSPPLTGVEECDLAVVGGGFTGLWAALLAAERDPARRVVVLEAGRVGWQGSGRNGGFCMSTLTHGAANGLAKFPDEMARLEQLGRETLDAHRGDLRDVRHRLRLGTHR